MITTQKQIKETTEKLLEQLVDKGDGEIAFTMDSIESNSKYYRALSNVINGMRLDEKFLYNSVHDILMWIEDQIDCGVEDIDRLRDRLFEYADMNTPVYTSSLTEWLNKSNYHVYYLDDAMNELTAQDGFRLLSGAYFSALREIGHNVIDEIENLIENG